MRRFMLAGLEPVEHDLEAIAMTPESFGKVVENDDLSRIMADNPYGFRD